MTALEKRLKQLESRIYQPKDCDKCGGTGTLIGRKRGSRYSGCAKCVVAKVMGVRVSVEDFKWLLKQARA